MPRGDRKGPMGIGPKTGRGAGNCNGFTEPGYANPAQFAGGLGCRFGRGFRRMFSATGMPGWARDGYPANAGTNTSSFDEKTFLKSQAEFLENQLQQVKKQLSSLEPKAE